MTVRPVEGVPLEKFGGLYVEEVPRERLVWASVLTPEQRREMSELAAVRKERAAARFLNWLCR